MYQVYHKNSTATSVYAWGYREIKGNPSQYADENDLLNKLSDLIDDGRETMDRRREGYLRTGYGLCVDLAVEAFVSA